MAFSCDPSYVWESVIEMLYFSCGDMSLMGYLFGLGGGCSDSSSDKAKGSLNLCCQIFNLLIPGLRTGSLRRG